MPVSITKTVVSEEFIYLDLEALYDETEVF